MENIVVNLSSIVLTFKAQHIIYTIIITQKLTFTLFSNISFHLEEYKCIEIRKC